MTKKKKGATELPLPTPSQLVLNPQTTTPAMRSSLEKLHSTLICPLCHQVFDEPATMTCGHSFCLSCMDEYAADNWYCPISTCGAPLACRGSREGSYLSINPQIQTVVTSLDIICKALNDAPPEWWNAEEEEEQGSDEDEEMVDFQQYSPSRSQRSQPEEEEEEEEEYSPEDSEQTEAFARPTTHARAAPQNWMDAIVEHNDNRSCGLPSQSPNVSPIAHMTSQQELVSAYDHMEEIDEAVEHGKSSDHVDAEEESPAEQNESPTIRFEDSASVDTKMPSVSTVLVASALSSKDFELMDTLVSANKMKLVTICTTDQNTAADFAVCGNAEMETGDGFLVGRTYAYLLAVARGIPVVNISYFEEENQTLESNPEEEHKHQVIGDVDSTEWMAPQRAIKSNKEGSKLLNGFTVLLFGDFESLPTSHTSKRSRRGAVKKNEDTSQSIYSLERLECLLRACGATVVRDITSLVGVDGDKVAVMLRPDPHTRHWRAARKELEDYPTIPLIRGNWLLDSISNFRVRDVDDYTQASKK